MRGKVRRGGRAAGEGGRGGGHEGTERGEGKGWRQVITACGILKGDTAKLTLGDTGCVCVCAGVCLSALLVRDIKAYRIFV